MDTNKQKKSKKIKNKKVNLTSGITLLSLVITIIVLIILAGITINLTIGEKGIFNYASRAKTETQIAQYKEKIEFARLDVEARNEGKVTLDELISQIYTDKIVPVGNIEKLEEKNEEDEEQAKVVTAEGYIFIITAHKVEYIGQEGENKGDESGKEEEIPDLQEGDIIVSTPLWDAITHKATVTLSKGDAIASNLQIQYQVNGYAEENWTTGTTVVNLDYNDTVYIRLWNGTKAGSYTSRDIKDSKDPQDAIISINGTSTTTDSSLTATVQLIDNESGVDIKNSKWVYTSVQDALILNESNFTHTFETNPEEIILTTTTPGTYYLHVLTKDMAGRMKETISEVIEVTQGETLLANAVEIGDYVAYDPTNGRSYSK